MHIDNGQPSAKQRPVYILFLVLQIILYIFLIVFLVKRAPFIAGEKAVIASADCLSIFLFIPIYISVLTHIGMRSFAAPYLLMIFVNDIYLAANAMHYITDGMTAFAEANGVMNIIYRVCPVVLSLAFWKLLDKWSMKSRSWPKSTRFLYIVAAADIIYIFCNVFMRHLFDISKETGVYVRGPLGFTTQLIYLVYLIVISVRIIVSGQTRFDKIVLIIYPVLPFIVAVYSTCTNTVSFVPVIVAFSFMLFYTFLFVRESHENIVRERDLTESRLRVLQMQINPHFLYNTLASAGSLCETDPEGAQDMIYLLSDYLHGNFTDIEKPSMIRFSEELDHLRSYISIQKIRFPEISVEYELRTMDFDIPVMTLQPLVENAIRYGIRPLRDRKGVICITSDETPEEWIICVKDNGVGFDTGNINVKNKAHIGISNVRTRLRLLCKGSIEYNSVVSRGTICRIVIPKEKKMKDKLQKYII